MASSRARIGLFADTAALREAQKHSREVGSFYAMLSLSPAALERKLGAKRARKIQAYRSQCRLSEEGDTGTLLGTGTGLPSSSTVGRPCDAC